jgi:hypothetical protein
MTPSPRPPLQLVLQLAIWTVLAATAAEGQDSGKPLTNRDVVNLLRTGTPEEKIVATIRTRPASFEVSDRDRASFDRECGAFKPAAVSNGAWAAEIREIWETMKNVVICRQTNGRGGEGACDPGSPRTPARTD